MPQISQACQPGNWKNKEGWLPQCAWEDDTYVPWGGKGLVLVKEGESYTTAFFEAFPHNPDTFIRGEGRTVPEAEQDAWNKFQRIRACPGHEFERRGYTNGCGFCKHCNMSSSKAFEPLEQPAPVLPPDEDDEPISPEDFRRGLEEVFAHILKRKVPEEGSRVEAP